jgi:hypothetical protein
VIFNPANNIRAAAGTSTSGLGNRTLIRSKTTGHMIGRFKSIRISRNGECPLTKNMTNHAAFTSTSYHPLSCNLYNVGLSFATSFNTALQTSLVLLCLSNHPTSPPRCFFAQRLKSGTTGVNPTLSLNPGS